MTEVCLDPLLLLLFALGAYLWVLGGDMKRRADDAARRSASRRRCDERAQDAPLAGPGQRGQR